MKSMFAVIKTGGKQYLVSPGETIHIEKLEPPSGASIIFDEILLVGDEEDDSLTIGNPLVAGAMVEGIITKQGRTKKVIVFKYHNKTRYRKKAGHRQNITDVHIDKINFAIPSR